MRYVFTLLVCLWLTQSWSQTPAVSGYVLDVTTNRPVIGARVYLHLRKDTAEAMTVSTDTTGAFVFENVKPDAYYLSCFYKMPASSMFLSSVVPESTGRSDTDSAFVLSPDNNYHHTFYLMIACPYDSTKNLAYCPRCKKKDMVQPIFWGEPAYDKNGKFQVSGKDVSHYYLGGSSPDYWCNPTKHCRRCNINF